MNDRNIDLEANRPDPDYPREDLRGAAIVLWIAFLVLMASVGGALYAMGATSL